MQDPIENFFVDVSRRTPDQIMNEVKNQRSRGQFGIALELISRNKSRLAGLKELSRTENALINDLNNSQKHLEFWQKNKADTSIYANAILSSRDGLRSVIALQHSWMMGLRELLSDPISLACEISLIARDDYPTYEFLRMLLTSPIHEMYNNGNSAASVAIRLVCEAYIQDSDENHNELLCLMNEAQPWQMARIFRSQKLKKNIEITKKITDDVISRNIRAEDLSDLQKINMLAIAYTVLSHEKYKLLCQVIASTSAGNSERHEGWKKAWIEASNSASITRSPITSIRNRKLKIAVCVSGQLRGYKSAKMTWERLGLSEHDADYYVHTWKNVGVRFPDPSWRPHVERRFKDKKFVDAYINMCEKYGISKLKEMYPSLFSTDSGDFIATIESLKGTYGNDSVIVIDDELEERFLTLKNPDKMYYKIKECFNLAQASGKNYDLIIKIRPDLKFNEGTDVDWHEVYETCAKDNVVYTETPPQLKENLFVGDQFGVTTADIAKIYSSTYDFHNLAKSKKISGMPGVRTGHHTLGWTLMLHGIKTEHLTQIKWAGLSDIQKLDSREIKSLIERDHKIDDSDFIYKEFIDSLTT